MPDQYVRFIGSILCRRRGNPEPLLKALEKLEPLDIRQLYQYLKDFEDDLHRAEHTYQPFPGGPRVRM